MPRLQFGQARGGALVHTGDPQRGGGQGQQQDGQRAEREPAWFGAGGL